MYPRFLLGWQTFLLLAILTIERSLLLQTQDMTRFLLQCEGRIGVKSLSGFSPKYHRRRFAFDGVPVISALRYRQHLWQNQGRRLTDQR